LKEAGMRLRSSRSGRRIHQPGESEGPQVAEALGIYFKDVGIESEIEVLDWAKVREGFRKKTIGCCIWPNIIPRPSEDWIMAPTPVKGWA
jgi:hypothetical protein